MRTGPIGTPTTSKADPERGRRLATVWRALVSVFVLWMVAAMAPWACSQSNNPRQSIINPLVNRMPDANERMEMETRQARNARYEAANAERKRELTGESERLLQLTNELKVELDRDLKNTLSVDEARKAEEIARLARSVQMKMKLTVNASHY